MKKYRVNVNGNNYEIAIELIDEATAIAGAKAAAPAPVQAAAPAPQAAPAGGEKNHKSNAWKYLKCKRIKW